MSQLGPLNILVRDAINAARLGPMRLSVRKIAAESGLSSNEIYNVVTGRTKVSAKLAAKLAKVLGKPKGWPFDVVAQTPSVYGDLVSIAGTPMMPIKVVGRASAGFGESNVDTEPRNVYVPESLGRSGGIGFEVSGDSMMPDIYEGDVLVFKDHHKPRANLTYLIETSEREFMVKRIVWESERWIAKSRNPAYQGVPLDEVSLIGYVIGLYRVKSGGEVTMHYPSGMLPEHFT